MNAHTATSARDQSRTAVSIPFRPIVLVGMPGSGKSETARHLADLLGVTWTDSDVAISGSSSPDIPALFAAHGEAGFRVIEFETVRRLLNSGIPVLAVGGGAFSYEATRAEIQRRGVSVFLSCPAEVLVARVAATSGRPLIPAGQEAEAIESLLARRQGDFTAAHHTVLAGEAQPREVARAVLAELGLRTESLAIRTGGEGTYDIRYGFGLADEIATFLRNDLDARRAVVITDDHVGLLHLDALDRSLRAAAIETSVLTVSAGEGTKSLSNYAALLNGMAERHVDRETVLLALGGGVVGDLAGFAAGTMLRGLPFVQVPTSLLAMVDSSVGGKTGINLAAGKNLAGVFYQPRQVFIDLAYLRSLPLRELISGYAEVIKCAVLEGGTFWSFCREQRGRPVQGDLFGLREAIVRSVAFKARIVEDDAFERRRSDGRILLNLGHTFAHAIEAEAGYDGSVLHGEAVAVGLMLALRLSVAIGLTPGPDLVAQVEYILRDVGLPTALRELCFDASPDRLLERFRSDKKNSDGKTRFILVRAPGDIVVTDAVDPAVVRTILARDLTGRI